MYISVAIFRKSRPIRNVSTIPSRSFTESAQNCNGWMQGNSEDHRYGRAGIFSYCWCGKQLGIREQLNNKPIYCISNKVRNKNFNKNHYFLINILSILCRHFNSEFRQLTFDPRMKLSFIAQFRMESSTAVVERFEVSSKCLRMSSCFKVTCFDTYIANRLPALHSTCRCLN